MSRVLFLVNHDVVIYNFRLELVERLLKEGHKVIISSPYGERIEDLIALGCEYHEIKIDRHGKNPFKDFALLKKYESTLKRIKPDVVLTFTLKPNIYGAMACGKLQIPCIANITGLGTAVENGGILQKITVFLYRRAFRKIQTIFFQNQENMQFFIDRKIYPEKHKLLPGSGVNLERFQPLEYPDTPTVDFVFISRLMKEKGTDQYLDAAEYIHKKYPYTRFHICGFCEKEYKNKLAELQNNDAVIYHGMVKDVRTVLKDTHCTIHPTYYPEGLSNVLLESCACARPIITTDRAGCREVIEDGVNGFVVKQKDSRDLILQIEKFLSLTNSERKKMGLAGREKVEREFDRNIVVKAYLEEIGVEENAPREHHTIG